MRHRKKHEKRVAPGCLAPPPWITPYSGGNVTMRQKASNFGSAVFGRDVPGGDRRNVDGGTPGGVAAAAGAANDRVAGRSTAGSAGTAGGGAAAAGAANERWDAAAGVAAGVTATPCVDVVTSKTDGRSE